MPATKVLILFNEPELPEGHSEFESEHEVLETVQFVQRSLSEAGYSVLQLALGRNPGDLLEVLNDQHPDVVFNLYEGTVTHSNTEAQVAGLLEWLGVPFTGSPSQALCLARNKHLAKQLLLGAGLPTPAFFAVDAFPFVEGFLRWPVIVKPARHDASEGLDQGSVVTDLPHLHKRVAYLLANYGAPVLAEEFIAGREFNVALVETPLLQALPVSEVLFLDTAQNYWPIVTYDAKWKPGSREFEATPAKYPADIPVSLAERLVALARKAFRLLGCRDYARVDFRVTDSGEPFVLEVNPNPDFHPTAGLPQGLACAGMTHAQFTVQLIRNALTCRRAA